jgi:hypothetical protein
VRLDEGDDPPVYGRNEGEPVHRNWDHFSDYVSRIVDQEFGLVEAGPENEGGRMPSSTPTAETVPEPLSIVPPDLKPDRSWFEESVGFLPPSMQERLGDLRASFKPSTANLFAAIVFGILFILAGLTLMALDIREVAQEHFQMPWFAPEGMSWLMFGLIQAASLGFIVGGVLMIRHALRSSRSRAYIGERGICRARDGQHEVLLWTEIRDVEEVVIRDRPPINTPFKHFIPFGTSRRYVLRSADGRQLSFDDNNVRSFARFEAILRRATAVHHVAWSVVHLRT